MDSFADFLKKFRKNMGLSQSEAAKLTNTSVRTWQQWEIGRRFPTHEMAIRALCEKIEGPTSEPRPPKKKPKAAPTAAKLAALQWD